MSTTSHYDGGHATHTVHAPATDAPRRHDFEVQAVPRDRVRWGPVLAGLFAALSTGVVLAVLGVAIGASAADRNDTLREFGIGTGIWAAVSAILAFAVGGYVSASTAATPASGLTRGGKLKDDNGLLQGAMVWAVAIPLTIYFLAGGLTRAAGAAGSAVGTAAQTAAAAANAGATAAAPAVGAATEDAVNRAGGAEEAANRAGDKVAATTQQAADKAQGAVDQAKEQARQVLTPENAERAADVGAKVGWGTLASLLIGLAAASIGGFLGGKSRDAVVRA